MSFFCDFFANISLTPIYTLFFREKFLLTKRCRFHCSWKLVALSLTVLTLILSSVIAYFGGKCKLIKEYTKYVYELMIVNSEFDSKVISQNKIWPDLWSSFYFCLTDKNQLPRFWMCPY